MDELAAGTLLPTDDPLLCLRYCLLNNPGECPLFVVKLMLSYLNFVLFIKAQQKTPYRNSV